MPTNTYQPFTPGDCPAIPGQLGLPIPVLPDYLILEYSRDMQRLLFMAFDPRIDPTYLMPFICSDCGTALPPSTDNFTLRQETGVHYCNTCGTSGRHYCTRCHRLVAGEVTNGLCMNCIEPFQTLPSFPLATPIGPSPTGECQECGAICYQTYENCPICSACADELELSTCTHCGELLQECDLVDFNGDLWCQSCLDEETVFCDGCDERVFNDDAHSAEERLWCETCFSEIFTACDNCGEIIRQDDSRYCERDDQTYCQSCYDEHCQEENIHDYSYKPSPVFHGTGDFQMGFELEVSTDDKGDVAETVVRHYDEDTYYCKEDGSVDLEIVSHPGVLAWHQENMPGLCNTLKKAGARGYNTGTMSCGIHVHVGRKRFSEIELAKVFLLVNCHADQWRKVSRRKSTYAAYGYDEYGGSSIRKVVSGGHHERYVAVNFKPESTFEFRVFRSTTNPESALAYIEIVHAACSFCKSDKAVIGRMLRGEAWGDFMAYVRVNRKSYKSLVPFLLNLDLI